MKKLLLIIAALLTAQHTFAQPSQIKRTWHWYFGNRAGIDFSSGTAVADTNGALITSEGCAAISDTAGNLQFYSDGRTVWNRLHQIMPNGTGIMGGALGSSTQQALIIPKPLSPNLYYLFTTDEAENQGANGMRYSVIDMNLDGGNGDIINSQKNILLFAPCTEKLAAVNHCNDTSVWVMGHEVNNNHFRTYLLTSNGIDTNAVISAVGHNNPVNVQGGVQGLIKFSPDGKMVCAVNDSFAQKVELFEFDNITGYVFNGFLLVADYPQIQSISFAPNNTMLYVGQQGSNKLMRQFNVLVFDSITIINSANIVSPTINRGFRALLNSSVGKLFCLEAALILADSMLCAIENPDIYGINCSLNLNFSNAGTWQFGSNLPNFNESYFRQFQSTNCTTGITEYNYDFIKVFPNPPRDWIYLEGSGITSVALFDVFGRVIINQKTDAVSLLHKLNVSTLSNGMYVLIATTKNQTLSSKIIKQ